MSDKYAPDSLKYQWRIISLVLRSGWATSLDKSIAFEIVDNYRKDHGNSRASLSYLVNATGADRKSVIASTRRLVENGPFSIARQGSGTRPTEYNINFDLVREKPSSGADTTTINDQSSSGVDTTTGGGVDTTTSASSSGADTTESVLPYAAYKADIQDRMIDCAPASPPPTVGLEATVASGAQGGFEELWKTYFPKRGQGDKKKARSAYENLNPDADLQASLVEAAGLWFHAWQAQGKPEAPRKHLDTWLTGEHYDCEPPTAYKAKERKPMKRAEASLRASSSETMKPTNDNDSDRRAGRPAHWRRGVHKGEFVAGAVNKNGKTTEVELKFVREDGVEFIHKFYTEYFIQKIQDEGVRVVEDIVVALGLPGAEDTDDFLFKPIAVKADAEKLTYLNIKDAA